jgi:hypothetical protein
MRFSALVLALPLLALAVPAQADENFIPMGHGYSLDSDSLPSLDSDQSQLTSEVDILQTDIYYKQRAQQRFLNQLDDFDDRTDSNGPDNFLDY